jgi:M6 family metalloprotease-like protein
MRRHRIAVALAGALLLPVCVAPTAAQALPIHTTNPVGDLSVVAPPETAPVTNQPGTWADVPGLGTAAYTRAGGSLAMTVSAEVYATNPVWLRALVDGRVSAPGDVVFRFAGTEFDGTRSFTFGAENLAAGKHIVQVQWYSNAGQPAKVRDRSLSVNSASAGAGTGRLVHVAAESDWLQKSTQTWENVPNLARTITLDGTRDLAVTFSGQTTSGSGGFFARALVDGQPTADVLFENPGVVGGARSYTFVRKAVGGGSHSVVIQWLASGGTILLGDRALTAYAAPASGAGGGLLATAVEQAPTAVTSTAPVDVANLAGSFATSDPGTNVAVTISTELASAGGRTFLRPLVDGLATSPGDVSFSAAVPQWHAQTYTFVAKNLRPGTHSVRVQMAVDAGATATVGDRALAVTFKRRGGTDFAQPYASLAPRVGTVPAVAICFDPRRPGHAPPTAAYLRAVHDGSDGGISTQAWYRENTGGQYGFGTPTLVGCTDNNWLAPPPGRTGTWYWDTGNFALMWQDALKAADPFFNFKAFDRNNDNVLSGDELVVEIVRPQNDAYGTNRFTTAPLDGVTLGLTVLDMYISPFTDTAHRRVNVGVTAHEAAHDILGAADMYSDLATRPGWYSIMDSHWNATHLDPFHKLKSGFVTPDVVAVNGWSTRTVPLGAVETQREVTIVYDPARGDREYFILENRWGGNGNYDQGLPVAQGIVVWHIVEDTATQDQFPPPGSPVGSGDWGRKGVRLVGALSGAGQAVTLRYANGAAAGITVTAKAGPQEFLSTEIARS